jgi:hypothetical protein
VDFGTKLLGFRKSGIRGACIQNEDLIHKRPETRQATFDTAFFVFDDQSQGQDAHFFQVLIELFPADNRDSR